MTKFSLVNFYYSPNFDGDSVTCYFKNNQGDRTKICIDYKDYFYIRGTNCIYQLKDLGVSYEVVKLLDMNNPDYLTIGMEHFTKVYYGVVGKAKKQAFLDIMILSFPDQCFEYDLDMESKIAMDLSLNIGKWYTLVDGLPVPCDCDELRPTLYTMVFDLETCKKPYLFPNSKEDEIMSIGVMFNTKGFVFVNLNAFSRSEDMITYMGENDFKNSTHTILYFDTEKDMLHRFVHEVLSRPVDCWVGYNSDDFDLPYLHDRCKVYGIDLYEKFGFQKYKTTFTSNKYIHLDLIYWVIRDSYLPMGRRRLKDVAKSKLQFEADDVDPEEMMELAKKDPHKMLHYNISDVVTTYMLNKKFVENFIFALGSIVPLTPDKLLRKGTGTICDTGMLAFAKKKCIKIENKPEEKKCLLFKDKVCKSETYMGGSVESNVVGIYNGQHKTNFKIELNSIKEIKADLKEILYYNFQLEGISNVVNLEEVITDIEDRLDDYFDYQCLYPDQEFDIYHFDVKAMYPSIILTYRLQPHAIRHIPTCEDCQEMRWTWKGDVFNMTSQEYMQFLPDSRESLIKKCKEFVTKSKRKPQIKAMESLEKIYVCQRQNPFFVNVVEDIKNMRDYYKQQLKLEKQTTKNENKIMHFDNLQLSYKCILNSCYGWLKMYGNRWGENAKITGAIVCQWAREIIQAADAYLDGFSQRINRDTDGTFRRVPKRFVTEFTVKTEKNEITLNLLNCMLNYMLLKNFTNKGYIFEGERIDKNLLSFEVDGPYPMMYLPGSNDNSVVKKKYVVFNNKNSIQEIKGLEIIRRGEWSLLKKFQKDFFEALSTSTKDSILDFYEYLKTNIVSKYDDVFLTHGSNLSEQELLDQFEQTKVASKSVNDYKSVSAVCTAIVRWGELNSNETFGNNPGTQCGFIISKYPESVSQISKRAIPTAVFTKPYEIKCKYLKKWTGVDIFDVHRLLDWDYYTGRWILGRDRAYTIPRQKQCPQSPDKYPTRAKKRRSPTPTASTSTSSVGPDPKQMKLEDFYTMEIVKNKKVSKPKPVKKTRQLNIKDFF